MIRSGKLCYCHKGESVGGSQALWKLLEKGEEGNTSWLNHRK